MEVRVLLVEPAARGRGLGRRLVAGCIRYARFRRYRRIVLRTNSVLDAARHLYESSGFRPASQGRHSAFGKGLIEQTWELELSVAWPQKPCAGAVLNYEEIRCSVTIGTATGAGVEIACSSRKTCSLGWWLG